MDRASGVIPLQLSTFRCFHLEQVYRFQTEVYKVGFYLRTLNYFSLGKYAATCQNSFVKSDYDSFL